MNDLIPINIQNKMNNIKNDYRSIIDIHFISLKNKILDFNFSSLIAEDKLIEKLNLVYLNFSIFILKPGLNKLLLNFFQDILVNEKKIINMSINRHKSRAKSKLYDDNNKKSMFSVNNFLKVVKVVGSNNSSTILNEFEKFNISIYESIKIKDIKEEIKNIGINNGNILYLNNLNEVKTNNVAVKYLKNDKSDILDFDKFEKIGEIEKNIIINNIKFDENMKYFQILTFNKKILVYHVKPFYWIKIIKLLYEPYYFELFNDFNYISFNKFSLIKNYFFDKDYLENYEIYLNDINIIHVNKKFNYYIYNKKMDGFNKLYKYDISNKTHHFLLDSQFINQNDISLYTYNNDYFGIINHNNYNIYIFSEKDNTIINIFNYLMIFNPKDECLKYIYIANEREIILLIESIKNFKILYYNMNNNFTKVIYNYKITNSFIINDFNNIFISTYNKIDMFGIN